MLRLAHTDPGQSSSGEDPCRRTPQILIAYRRPTHALYLPVPLPLGTASGCLSAAHSLTLHNPPVPLPLQLPLLLPLSWAPFMRHPQVSSEPWHLLRLLCQWRNELEITILPPYVPSEQEKADPKLYAANVRSLMARALNQPLLPHSNANFIALKKLKVGWPKAVLGDEWV